MYLGISKLHYKSLVQVFERGCDGDVPERALTEFGDEVVAGDLRDTLVVSSHLCSDEPGAPQTMLGNSKFEKIVGRIPGQNLAPRMGMD